MKLILMVYWSGVANAVYPAVVFSVLCIIYIIINVMIIVMVMMGN